jgi:hypothetical protein
MSWAGKSGTCRLGLPGFMIGYVADVYHEGKG